MAHTPANKAGPLYLEITIRLLFCTFLRIDQSAVLFSMPIKTNSAPLAWPRIALRLLLRPRATKAERTAARLRRGPDAKCGARIVRPVIECSAARHTT